MAVAMAVRANGRAAAALHVLEPHAWTAARAVVTPLVCTTWPGIMRTAALLFRSGQIGHEDVCDLLGVAAGDQLALARLRRVVPGWVQLEHRIALAQIAGR